MAVTGLYYKQITVSTVSDFAFEGLIPFEGEDLVMTKISRNNHSTEISKYKLPQDTIDQFRALIEKYNVTDWAGKTPSAPAIIPGERTGIAYFLTLIFDDGTSSEITFRETENGKEAADEFRRLFFGTAIKENMISFEEVYPNLKDCREIKENHGPVVAVETGSFSCGMMAGSSEQYTQTVEKIEGKEGTVRVTVKVKRGDNPEQTCSKETVSDIFSKVQELSDKENLPGWNYACLNPEVPIDYSMRPTDYTCSGWLNIYYDDSLITGCPRIKRTIGEMACKLGGKEVDRIITEMINECVAKSGAKIDLSNDNPYLAGFQPFECLGMKNVVGMTMEQLCTAQEGSWTCRMCGTKDLKGNFCSECGASRY